MLYYNPHLNLLGLLTNINGYGYLQIEELGCVLIPFIRARWDFVGAA